MSKIVKIYYTTNEFNFKNIDKEEMDLTNHRMVCRMFVENKESDSFFLNEIFKLFNWTVKGIDSNDAFLNFQCPPEVNHINLTDGDIVAINNKHYIYNNKKWNKVDVETEAETVTEKVKVKKETTPIKRDVVENVKTTSNGKINVDDVVIITNVSTNKNGKQVSILNNRRAQVVGFSKRNPNVVKVILFNKNNQLQNCTINVDIESLILEEDVSVV